MINCVIIDDEPMARKLLQNYCGRVVGLSVAADFSNGLSALTYLSRVPTDLIFLDIKMPDITGLELLKSMTNRPAVIFTTAFAEHAIDGFELDAVDYLLKPFDFPRFLRAINKAMEKLQKAPEKEPLDTAKKPFIFVKDGRQLVKLHLDDIRYIKGQKDYVSFYLPEKKVMSLMNLKDLEKTLPESQFVRIHQSYIININHADLIEREKVKIGEEFIPISQSYRLSFRNFMSAFRQQ